MEGCGQWLASGCKEKGWGKGWGKRDGKRDEEWDGKKGMGKRMG